MTDDEKADVQLARDVLTETLHGPVPIATVARLAQALPPPSEEVGGG